MSVDAKKRGPEMANRKVNLYKWHRMKKKLISSVISILCCLAVMAVGVYASTTASFAMTISNDISIQIAVVDGTLSAKRRGGVFAQDTISGNAGQIAGVFGTLKSGGNANNFADYQFIELYNQNTTSLDGVNGNLKTIQDQKLDINVYHNEIEYIFKYEVEENNGAPTYISIDDLGAGGVLGGLYAYLNNANTSEDDKNRVTLTYSYVAGGSDLVEPTDWTVGQAVGSYVITAFPVNDSNGNSTNYISIGGNGEGVNTCVYIRCYLRYNTSAYGNYNYDSSVVGSDALSGMVDDTTSESNKASFHRDWKFKLNLSSSTATAS